MKELYRKYRPKKFEDVIGQEDAVKTLTKKFEKHTVPHAILFHGPFGTGKTTLARIVAKELKCSNVDFVEKNTADYRGIDDVREIRAVMNQAPMDGDVKIWLMDECFAANTLVETPTGKVKINDIRKGDSVYSCFGVDKVKNTFRKNISLNRLVKVVLSNGETLFCSDGHLFYTEKGWIRAKNLLKNDLLFCFVPNIMQEKKKGTTDGNNYMSSMWKGSFCQNQSKKEKNMLQQVVCNKISLSKDKKTMSRMWEDDYLLCKKEGKIQQNFLQQKLSCERQNDTTGISETNIQREGSKKIKQFKKRIFSNETRKNTSKELFSTNDKKQSCQKSRSYKENYGNQIKKWNTPSMERSTGRQWSIYTPSTNSLGETGNWMGFGIDCTNQNEEELSYQLQSGYRKQEIQNSCGSRWNGTSLEEIYTKRYKENEDVKIVRVESIEIYQSGNNEEHFKSIVEDKEKHRNKIELYDLEMENHPSFFANNILVHNCHKATNDGQNAMLKLLEDPPDHVYFFLATTDPEKLLQGIKQRCLSIKLNPIKNPALLKILQNICKKESIKIDEEVLEKIVEYSGGSARDAIQILDKVYLLDDTKEQLTSITKASVRTASIEIARKLINTKTKWRDIAPILKELENEDPETIRWMILGYGKSVLLNKDNTRAYRMIQAFRDNFYDCKGAGIVASCWEVLCGE